jgi:hypothetical protein
MGLRDNFYLRIQVKKVMCHIDQTSSTINVQLNGYVDII